MGDVTSLSQREVVDAPGLDAASDELVAEMAPDEPRATDDERAHPCPSSRRVTPIVAGGSQSIRGRTGGERAARPGARRGAPGSSDGRFPHDAAEPLACVP